MNLEQRPEHRLEQKLNAQLILNLKLLTLPINELEQLIEDALEHNPALEQADEPLDYGVEGFGPELGSEPVDSLPSGKNPLTPADQPAEKENSFDEFNLSELLPQDAWENPVLPAQTPADETSLADTAPNQTLTLRDTLLPRLLAELNPEDAQIAEQVIEWLNPDGYLIVSEQELTEAIGAQPKQVQRVLSTLHRIPPGGIGCHDARQALLIQLELKGVATSALEYRLLSEAWETLRVKNIPKLAKLLGVTVQEVQQALSKILTLDPRPARKFTETVTPYVIPDFSIEWHDNQMVAVLQDDRIPRLRLAKRFLDIIQDPGNYSRDQVQFAREKVKNGLMFLKAIESRRRLLCRLARLILEQQQEFFIRGPHFLKPVTLRQAALELGVSPSTVSRALSGKYIETPFGIFEMKYFFQAGKDGLSRTSIKQKIQTIVENEDKKSKPLSDEEIGAQLKEQGIVISRRAVAKYRAELGIPSSEERRQF
ncbi:MAG: RNA polymerase factor sigma-54 [bacterium]